MQLKGGIHMYKDDSVFRMLLKYNFNLYRGNMTISEYLGNHFEEYISDISKAADGENPLLGNNFTAQLKDKLCLIKEICHQIIDTLKSNENGNIKESYDKAYALFDMLSPFFLSRFSAKDYSGVYYRIRQGDFRIKPGDNSKSQKAELFHIKQNLRKLIGAYRYSIAGFPCLYLSSGIELAWFECGMPRQFSYCRMKIEETGEDALKLIDFSNRPIELLSNIHVWLLNSQSEEQTKAIYKYLLNYIITYPLTAACSIKVKQRESKFIEEYIVPQLLMQWISVNNNFDGIMYKSSLYTDLVQGMGAVNIVLPVKKFRDDGLCENLTSKISVSDIGYLDVNIEFAKYKEQLSKIEDFKNELTMDMVSSKYKGQYILNIIDICELTLKIYRALIEGKYDNIELIFSFIDGLFDYIYSLYSNVECIVKKVQSDLLDEDANTDEIKRVIHDFYELISQVVHKHTVFHFHFESLSNYEKI